MRIFLVTGIGKKDSLANIICKKIQEDNADVRIIGVAYNHGEKPDVSQLDKLLFADLSSVTEIKELAASARGVYGAIHCIINCAGLSYLSWINDSNVNKFDELMNVNAKAMYVLTKELLNDLTITKGTVLNMVSNASHVPMRCSTAYNASKAAAKMITEQMARELTYQNQITIFSISPNKLKGTGMTKIVDKEVQKVRGWSEKEARDNQNAALLTGEQTDPKILAEFISFLLSKKERHFYLSGCDIPYGV